MQNQGPQAGGVKSGDVLAIAIPMILSNASVLLAGIADTAVVGQLNDPALIGGVSLGSTIFAMLFWAFGFLRMGTTGLTAKAAGGGNRGEIAANLYRPLLIAATGGDFLYTLHVPAILLTLRLMGGSPQVQTATAAYFGVRIMSAPATLANYALLGWFIGLALPKSGALAAIGKLYPAVIGSLRAICQERGPDSAPRPHHDLSLDAAAAGVFNLAIEVDIRRGAQPLYGRGFYCFTSRRADLHLDFLRAALSSADDSMHGGADHLDFASMRMTKRGRQSKKTTQNQPAAGRKFCHSLPSMRSGVQAH